MSATTPYSCCKSPTLHRPKSASQQSLWAVPTCPTRSPSSFGGRRPTQSFGRSNRR
ncbi:unnamed protein product [Durusdinium trenchii]|uniref:Uncharacterized protein n=1 Tax=Durusdinium trenchii TaxID=1381693 RepID=A0ABP0N5M2_9DINO